MPVPKSGLKERWQKIRSLPQFRNVLTFMAFVAVATLFWVVLALNDSVTHTFRVRVVLKNVPDTVTFISDPPTDMTVTMRDRGTNLLRSGIMRHPSLDFNFSDYARNGIFRMSKSDMMADIKERFGSGIQIMSMSLDSIRLYYTDSPGRRVPVDVKVNVTASSGNIISGVPVSMEKSVKIYSYGNEIDTVNKVETELLSKRDLSQTSIFEVKIRPIAKVRIVPPVVQVKVPVESLVAKEGYAQVESLNVPDNVSLLLFPTRIPITYYVPMSRFGEKDPEIVAYADYEDTRNPYGNKLAVRLGTVPKYIVNPVIQLDSVEYTLVKR